jgi:hypothetical protein
MSLELVLSSLNPSQNSSNLQQIPSKFVFDPILLAWNCPRYFKEFERIMSHELRPTLDAKKEIFEELSTATGWNFENPHELDFVLKLYSTLKSEVRKFIYF